MRLVGHERVRRLLEAELPPVALLRGANSIGKWKLALHLAEFHQVQPVDRFIVESALGSDTVHRLQTWAGRRSHGPFKLALIDLAGASHRAYYLLLKLLEEPPADVRFILVSSGGLPAVLISRCEVFTMAALPEDQLTQVLTDQGMSRPAAQRAAREGRGQVAPALARTSDAAHATVCDLMRAVARRDTDLFETAIAATDAVTRDLLHRWFVEAMTGQRILFTDEDMHGLHNHPRKLSMMLSRLSTVPAAHARLGVRVALEPFLAA
jgi:hypothetical protein